MKEIQGSIDINLSVDFDILCEEIFPYVNSISSAPLGAIIRDEFLRQLNQSAASQVSQLIPKIRVEGWPNRYIFSRGENGPSFAEIFSHKWFMSYTGILVQTYADKAISNLSVSVDAPMCILDEPDLQLWKYRRIEHKKLTKHMHRMHLNYPSDVFEPFRTAQCDCQTTLFMSNPDWGILDFQCRICGKHYFCSCCESLYQQYFRQHKGMVLIAKKYGTHEFRPNLCHICRGISPELENWGYYNASFSSKYAPYIQWEFIKEGLSADSKSFKEKFRVAENRLRVQYGYPKVGEGWISEANLLNTIKELYPHTKVIHQGSPSWLGLQRFDVWLPEFNIAVEYQGRQHYEPIEHFGGQDGFRKCQERDAKKKCLAEQNGVTIVYFSCEGPLILDLIKERLTKAIENKIGKGKATSPIN